MTTYSPSVIRHRSPKWKCSQIIVAKAGRHFRYPLDSGINPRAHRDYGCQSKREITGAGRGFVIWFSDSSADVSSGRPDNRGGESFRPDGNRAPLLMAPARPGSRERVGGSWQPRSVLTRGARNSRRVIRYRATQEIARSFAGRVAAGLLDEIFEAGCDTDGHRPQALP